ncbi:helix-turn-helix domain-containing protein [Maribrevibacterium harenarium]|uniref:Helix-turn-helix domain-containing protein n=1 Tax=Maribrevibacterium harenarium TaxID=2589817 RepID=A0A501X1W9_9GAMM|nr:RodZ domain-containing protein [Maribrevibacterium harenarium]TPE54472.1 helix-turn-helix domain-containing protein [Maribrevibacterium harenarium]
MNTEQELDQPVIDSAPSIDIGHLLQSKRLEMAFDLQHVAAELKLPTSQVSALEANQFERFRSSTFARGYLKSYCRLLNLDTKEILAAFDDQQAAVEPTVKPVDQVRKQAQYGDPMVMFITAVVVAIIIFVAFWWPEFEQQSTAKSESQSTVPELSVVTNEPEPIDSDTSPTLAELPELTMPELDLPEEEVVTGLSAETRALLEDAGVNTEQVVQATAIPEPEPEQPAIVEPAYTDDIEIRFSADCWTEIRDSSGRILFSGVKSSGSSLTLSGVAPYRVVLGYVPGVSSLKYKGEEFDYSRFIRKDLARFELK